MNFRLDVYIHNHDENDHEVLAALHQITALINDTRNQIMSALTDLQDAVAAEDTVIASAVTLLTGLKAALDAAIAAGNPAALKALSADIGKQAAGLAAAISANTPTPPALPPSTVVVTASANPTTVGVPVTLTATVSPATATGMVAFSDGVDVVNSGPLVSGVAAFDITFATAGDHPVTAAYAGDTAVGPSTSDLLVVTVA